MFVVYAIDPSAHYYYSPIQAQELKAGQPIRRGSYSKALESLTDYQPAIIPPSKAAPSVAWPSVASQYF